MTQEAIDIIPEEDDVDGCDVEMDNKNLTSDEELPAASGGIV